MQHVYLKAGATSQIIELDLWDKSKTDASRLTGLVFNAAGLTCYSHRAGAATATAVTLATMTLGTYAAGGFMQLDATNTPGLYCFCPPDTALAVGVRYCDFIFKGATNLAQELVRVHLDPIEAKADTLIARNEPLTAATTRTALGMGAASYDSDMALVISRASDADFYAAANNTILASAVHGNAALKGLIDGKPSLLQMEASSKLSHLPTSWIMWGSTSPGMSITTGTHGDILVGVLIDAFYQTDTGHTTPINSTTSAAGGVWSLPLPAGAYDLVFQYPGQTSVTVKVTVA